MNQNITSLSLNEMANTKNKYAVITVDETQNWRSDIVKKAKKIEGVYLVELRKPTHLCELAISFPAIFLRNYFHNIDGFDEDDVLGMEMDNGGDDYSYFNGYFKPGFVKYYKSGKEEDILEYEMGNPSYC